MSPAMQSRGKQITAPDNLYTVILAFALVAVLATAGFVAYLCHTQYETLFKIP
jgi:hypothetical protein